jgi:hypothetical protein
MKRTWLDETFNRLFPTPAHVVKLTIDFLDNWDPDGGLRYAHPALGDSVADHARLLIAALREQLNHVSARFALRLELQDPADNVLAFPDWKIAGCDDGNDLISCSTTRLDIEWQMVVVLVRRLINLFPNAPKPTAGPTDPRDGDGWENAVAAQGVQITYDGYTHTTHWELLTAERLTGQCSRCRRVGRTQLHHATYARLGAELPTDTREVCDACHRREHPRGHVIQRAFAFARRAQADAVRDAAAASKNKKPEPVE